jgi:hypothetical protein
MKLASILISASLVCELFAAPAFAQTTPAATPQSAKATRQACRQNLKAQNVADADMKAKMRTCMAPARAACQKQAAEQNVATGQPRRDFMKKCMST